MDNPFIELGDLPAKALRDFISIRAVGKATPLANGRSRQALLNILFIESVEDDLLKERPQELLPKAPCTCGACTFLRLLISQGTPVVILGEPPDPTDKP